MNEINIENVGPISGTFTIDLSQGPGLYELTGTKGTGKSTILSALDLISGHKVTLTVTDGELGGHISGFGVVAPIQSRKRKRGECEVDCLDAEKFNLIDLIRPTAKTPETRDSQRIKALASLSNLELTLEDFCFLAPTDNGLTKQQWVESLAIKPTDDPVLLASRVKEAIDQQARQFESVADAERGHAKGLQDRYEGYDFECESDADTLASDAERAASDLSRLEQSRKDAEFTIQRAEEANSKLAEVESSYDGPTLEEANRLVEKSAEVCDTMRDKVADIEEQLRKAQADLRDAENSYTSHVDQRASTMRHCQLVQQWKETIDKARDVYCPTQKDIDHAKQELSDARERQELGVRIRDAIAAKQRAEWHIRKAAESKQQAESLRAAAKSAWDVLANKLQTNVIRIESVNGNPRLLVEHPKRGKCFFDSVNGLSDGERVRCTIDELMPRLSSPGLLPLPQEIFQDLPPKDRRQLASYAEDHGMYLFGAQVDDGELCVKKYKSPKETQ